MVEALPGEGGRSVTVASFSSFCVFDSGYHRSRGSYRSGNGAWLTLCLPDSVADCLLARTHLPNLRDPRPQVPILLVCRCYPGRF